MSVIGQDAGIEHGTAKGFRQHKYRKVAFCEPCRAAHAREERSRWKPRTAGTASREWNGGMTGDTPASAGPRPQGRSITRTCAVTGCGDEADGSGRPGPNLVRVEFPGSREPARWYCPGACAGYGAALAEICAIPEEGDRP